MTTVKVVNERVGYNHVAYMLSVDFFPLLANYSAPPLQCTEHTTYSLLMLLSYGFLRQNKLLNKMNG
jgi:hypothetical protein